MSVSRSFHGPERIGQIAVPVADLDRAVAFYEQTLGLRLLFRSAPGLAFFDCGGVRLMLSRPEGPGTPEPAGILYYSVPDLAAAYEGLRTRGVEFVEPPRLVARMPDHELWMAILRDSEQNFLGLMSEVRPGGLKKQEAAPQLMAVDELIIGGTDRFTGQVRVGAVVETPGSPVAVYEVLFSAGARTVWHEHSGEQILVGLTGSCFVHVDGDACRVLAPGQAVRVAGGRRHWHGAGPEGAASHLGLNQTGGTSWGEPVDEAEYRAAVLRVVA